MDTTANLDGCDVAGAAGDWGFVGDWGVVGDGAVVGGGGVAGYGEVAGYGGVAGYGAVAGYGGFVGDGEMPDLPLRADDIPSQGIPQALRLDMPSTLIGWPLVTDTAQWNILQGSYYYPQPPAVSRMPAVALPPTVDDASLPNPAPPHTTYSYMECNVVPSGRSRRCSRRRRRPRKPTTQTLPVCIDLEQGPPALTDKCPAEERLLFHSHWEHRDKPDDELWSCVQRDFAAAFGSERSVESLKVTLLRCRVKYMQWTAQDEETLARAWANMEKNRYKTLLAAFYELGGSRNMMLGEADMKHKVVVELGLEKDLYIEKAT